MRHNELPVPSAPFEGVPVRELRGESDVDAFDQRLSGPHRKLLAALAEQLAQFIDMFNEPPPVLRYWKKRRLIVAAFGVP